MTRLLCTTLFFLTLIGSGFAQKLAYEAQQAPKRELRAVWIATVLNIDYPRSPSTNPIALKEQYRNLLDQLEELGMNAVIVQVRPAADAFYPSAYAPWSAYLTGQQGRPPQDEFDRSHSTSSNGPACCMAWLLSIYGTPIGIGG